MVEWKEAHPDWWWSYDTHRPKSGIRKAVVKRFTDKSVVVETEYHGRRTERTMPRFGRDCYYPLWEEARAECLRALDREIEALEREAQALKAKRQSVNELKKGCESDFEPWEKVLAEDNRKAEG